MCRVSLSVSDAPTPPRNGRCHPSRVGFEDAGGIRVRATSLTNNVCNINLNSMTINIFLDKIS